MNLNQNQADLSQQMQAISQSITKAKGPKYLGTKCPNCSQPITHTEVQDNICWTCQKELDE